MVAGEHLQLPAKAGGLDVKSVAVEDGVPCPLDAMVGQDKHGVAAARPERLGNEGEAKRG